MMRYDICVMLCCSSSCSINLMLKYNRRCCLVVVDVVDVVVDVDVVVVVVVVVVFN